MSTIQVANVNFESTANTQLVYATNTLTVRAGGANNISVNSISTTLTNATSTMLYASSNGNIGVGSSAPPSRFYVKRGSGSFDSASANSYAASIYAAQNATTNYGLQVRTNWQALENKIASFGVTDATTGAETEYFTLNGVGRVNFGGVYAVTVTTPRNMFIDAGGNVGGVSSTRSSKMNINPINDVNWIYEFEPVSFNYRVRDPEGNITDTPESELMYGLIAEDVEPVNKDLCIYVDGKLSGIHYDRLVSPLIQAVKDLKKIIDEQEIRIKQLEAL